MGRQADSFYNHYKSICLNHIKNVLKHIKDKNIPILCDYLINKNRK